MYNGEELIDTSKIDENNEEVMKNITTVLSNIYYEGSRSLNKYREQLNNHLSKANRAIEKSDVDKIEKKKSILSKILYFVGPSEMPVEMFDKQIIPEKSRMKFNNYNSQAREYLTVISGHLDALNKFQSKFEEMWRRVLLNNTNKIHFLGSMNSIYTNIKVSPKSADTVLMFELMEKYNYLDKSEENGLLRHGVGFLETELIKKLKELNNWYVTEIGNNKTK